MVLVLAGFGSGCDSGSSGEPEKVDLSKAGPNRRLNIKPEYKQAIKDGRLILKPGMKPPPDVGTPKS
jgi:hypothetical protein